jgi:2-hydroxy-4-carboxymuconate semialdehyde hemiacetal dehydrogenase
MRSGMAHFAEFVMNICLVGYGAIAEKHMEAFSAIDGVVPRVLVGRRMEPATEFAARWGFRTVTMQLDEALADDAIDAVVIASPNALHAEQAVASLQAHKHVLLEIPMALNLADAKQVVELAAKSDRQVMVAHTMRYFPALREIRRRVVEEDFTIQHIVGFFGLPRRENVTSAGKARSWTDDILWHFGAHMVDVVLWLTGNRNATAFSCQFGPKHPTQGVMDMSLSMTLPGGALFTLAQSFNLELLRWTLTVVGDQGTLEFDNGTLYDLKRKELVAYQSIVDLHEQNREFVDAVRNDRPPAITPADVLPAMGILDKAERISNFEFPISNL